LLIFNESEKQLGALPYVLALTGEVQIKATTKRYGEMELTEKCAKCRTETSYNDLQFRDTPNPKQKAVSIYTTIKKLTSCKHHYYRFI